MRGLAGTSCAASDTDFWFVGSGAVVGQRGRVYLTNPEAAPRSVDVTLYGPDGPIDAPSGRGVSVAAGRQEVRLLDALAPGIPRFAVHVHARQGRVAAAVRDQQIDGPDPLGADWVPPAAAPSRRVLVPGVPAGPANGACRCVAPGTPTRSCGSGWSASPARSPRPGSTCSRSPPARSPTSTSRRCPGRGGGGELTSDVPVTAGVLARVDRGRRASELAYAAANAPLTPATPGVVADAAAGEGVTSTLLLDRAARHGDRTAGAAAARDGHAREVRVPEGSQIAVDLATSAAPSVRGHGRPAVRRPARCSPSTQVSETDSRGPMLTTRPGPPGPLRGRGAPGRRPTCRPAWQRTRLSASARAVIRLARPSVRVVTVTFRLQPEQLGDQLHHDRRARGRRGPAQPGPGPRPGGGRRRSGPGRSSGAPARPAPAAPSSAADGRGTSSTTTSTAGSWLAPRARAGSTASSTSSSNCSARVRAHRQVPGQQRPAQAPAAAVAAAPAARPRGRVTPPSGRAAGQRASDALAAGSRRGRVRRSLPFGP